MKPRFVQRVLAPVSILPSALFGASYQLPAVGRYSIVALQQTRTMSPPLSSPGVEATLGEREQIESEVMQGSQSIPGSPIENWTVMVHAAGASGWHGCTMWWGTGGVDEGGARVRGEGVVVVVVVV